MDAFDVFKRLSEKEQFSWCVQNPLFREMCEIGLLENVKHIGGSGNVDGFNNVTGRNIEIKTRMAGLKGKIYGHLLYSDSSLEIYYKKIENGGETIYNSCYDPYGNVLFRFKVEWDDLKEEYFDKIKDGPKQGLNFCFENYKKHPSFEVDYVAPKELLKKEWFGDKFYEFLIKESDKRK